MKEKAAAEASGWIRLFDEMTGGAMVGTVPVGPDLAIEDGETVKLGGVSFRVHHTGHAHTDGDIMIELPAERVLFAGDIVNNQAVRRMDDGSFQGNIAAIDRMLATSAVHFVPGHGAPGDRTIVQQNRDYFAALYGTVKKLYNEARPDFEIKPRVVEVLAPFADWNAFESEVGRQVSLAYLEVEREAF
jgi:glyoxylase-like metal-dependent hydrolase (beta-lactamase superfamily II)